MKSLLLEDVRVVDLTTRESWHCARFLASLGADVVRIDLPAPAFKPDEAWRLGNVGKRCFETDYRSEDGAAPLRAAIEASDIVVESFAPGRMAQLGLGYERLRERNPRLVMVSITPFGQTGPYASFKGGELVVSAMSGIMSVNGHADRWPLKEAGDAHYFHAGMAGAFGGLVALRHARNCGRGQHVDISAQEVGASRNTVWHIAWQFDKRERTRIGPLLDSGRGPAEVVWETKDGHAILPMRAPGSPLLETIGQWMEELGYENPLAGPGAPPTQPDRELMTRWNDAVRRFLKDRTQQEIVTEGWARKAFILPVSRPRDIADDPQFAARGFLKAAVGDPELMLPQWYALTSAIGVDAERLPDAPAPLSELRLNPPGAAAMETAG